MLMAVVAWACGASAKPAPLTPGAWGGKLFGLNIVLNFELAGSKWSATLDSPDQGAVGIPCTMAYANDTVTVACEAIGAVYTGAVCEGEIDGSFAQGGMALPLKLKPVEAVALRRPQTPEPPFPYDSKEVSFTRDTLTFTGTLVTPATPGPWPAAVLVTGSGQQNRDEEIAGHRPFAVIADYLARHGVATLRYDDRGIGGSSAGAPGATTADYADDAMAALSMLRQVEGVDKGRTGFIGHSEGALIGLIDAAKDPSSTAFVVALAGPLLSGRETMVAQNRLIAAAVGQPLGEKELRQVEQVFGAIDSISSPSQLESTLRGILAEQGVAPDAVEQQVAALTSPWYTAFVRFDPSTVTPSVECPVLLLSGELDVQVDPVGNTRRLTTLLPMASHRTYDGLSHFFQPVGSAAEGLQPGRIETTIDERVLADMAYWITNGYRLPSAALRSLFIH